jgi:hypothetical protein
MLSQLSSLLCPRVVLLVFDGLALPLVLNSLALCLDRYRTPRRTILQHYLFDASSELSCILPFFFNRPVFLTGFTGGPSLLVGSGNSNARFCRCAMPKA